MLSIHNYIIYINVRDTSTRESQHALALNHISIWKLQVLYPCLFQPLPLPPTQGASTPHLWVCSLGQKYSLDGHQIWHLLLFTRDHMKGVKGGSGRQSLYLYASLSQDMVRCKTYVHVRMYTVPALGAFEPWAMWISESQCDMYIKFGEKLNKSHHSYAHCTYMHVYTCTLVTLPILWVHIHISMCKRHAYM